MIVPALLLTPRWRKVQRVSGRCTRVEETVLCRATGQTGPPLYRVSCSGGEFPLSCFLGRRTTPAGGAPSTFASATRRRKSGGESMSETTARSSMSLLARPPWTGVVRGLPGSRQLPRRRSRRLECCAIGAALLQASPLDFFRFRHIWATLPLGAKPRNLEGAVLAKYVPAFNRNGFPTHGHVSAKSWLVFRTALVSAAPQCSVVARRAPSPVGRSHDAPLQGL